MLRKMLRKMALIAGVIVLVGTGGMWLEAQAPAVAAQASPVRPAPTPEQLAIQAASEKDHQRMMDLLGIKALRPGASGDVNAPNAANYDESKADVYTNLPDPLVMKNGDEGDFGGDVVERAQAGDSGGF